MNQHNLTPSPQPIGWQEYTRHYRGDTQPTGYDGQPLTDELPVITPPAYPVSETVMPPAVTANHQPAIKHRLGSNQVTNAMRVGLARLTGRAVYAPFVANGGEVLDLITPSTYGRLPEGTQLRTITGGSVIKGQPGVDPGDTRGGFMAVGFMSATPHDRRMYTGRRRTS